MHDFKQTVFLHNFECIWLCSVPFCSWHEYIWKIGSSPPKHLTASQSNRKLSEITFMCHSAFLSGPQLEPVALIQMRRRGIIQDLLYIGHWVPFCSFNGAKKLQNGWRWLIFGVNYLQASQLCITLRKMGSRCHSAPQMGQRSIKIVKVCSFCSKTPPTACQSKMTKVAHNGQRSLILLDNIIASKSCLTWSK